MSRLVSAISLASLSLCLASCEQPSDTDTPLNTERPPSKDECRVQVTRIGVFKDTLAYNQRRGIYLIRDTTTGAEFIGVSGIGITELGSHTERVGKQTVVKQDER